MLMSTKQVMEKYGFSKALMSNYRKFGMPHTVLSERSVIYDSELVEEWVNKNLVNGRYSKFKSKGVK